MPETETPAEHACPPLAGPSAGSWALTGAEQLGPLRRDVVRAVHEADGTPEDVAARVVLIVSELATNALKYGSGPVTVSVGRAEGCWLVGVRDGDGGTPPNVYPHEGGRIGGHGLTIVARLSSRWGWHRTGTDRGHKCVWALVPRAPYGRGAVTRA